ncbi:MAG TPA: sterol carrier protein domain-containing protein, partial [Candidatus Dormibacteraeota bacterium]|nr:sterol carrier protein domain-containing protein [Candidatus Dormibacteraeota bacterium]
HADAERRLWRWLLDIDLVGRLRSLRQPLPPPLLHMLAEPRRLGVTVADGLWLRVVDLPGALEARGYGGVGALVLEVADAMCPWNDGRWRLDTGGPSAPDGSDPSAARARHAATIERTTDEPDLRLGAADLGAAYLGGVRFAELAAAGRVVEARPGSLVLADRLFASDRAPWCLTMF